MCKSSSFELPNEVLLGFLTDVDDVCGGDEDSGRIGKGMGGGLGNGVGELIFFSKVRIGSERCSGFGLEFGFLFYFFLFLGGDDVHLPGKDFLLGEAYSSTG